MVDRVIERAEVERPQDTVVVHDRGEDRNRSNAGTIIAIILVLIILALILGGGSMFGGGDGASTPSPAPDVNIQTSAPAAQ